MNKTTTCTMAVLLLAAWSAVAAPRTVPESGSLAETDQTLDWSFTPDPALPNVLILGDSISIGYTLQVRALLKGKANVYRPMFADGKRPVNCGGTPGSVKQLDERLKGPKWDVIHFNWGLHDLKHVPVAGKQGRSNNPDDPLMATLDEYTRNMEAIVAKLKTTGARLIFATTTPVAPGTINPLREPESPALYNAAALKIMQVNGIQVDDLFSFCKPHLKEWQLPQNVHFNAEGYAALAKQVASVIQGELAAANSD